MLLFQLSYHSMYFFCFPFCLSTNHNGKKWRADDYFMNGILIYFSLSRIAAYNTSFIYQKTHTSHGSTKEQQKVTIVTTAIIVPANQQYKVVLACYNTYHTVDNNMDLDMKKAPNGTGVSGLWCEVRVSQN